MPPNPEHDETTKASDPVEIFDVERQPPPGRGGDQRAGARSRLELALAWDLRIARSPCGPRCASRAPGLGLLAPRARATDQRAPVRDGGTPVPRGRHPERASPVRGSASSAESSSKTGYRTLQWRSQPRSPSWRRRRRGRTAGACARCGPLVRRSGTPIARGSSALELRTCVQRISPRALPPCARTAHLASRAKRKRGQTTAAGLEANPRVGKPKVRKSSGIGGPHRLRAFGSPVQSCGT